MSWNDHQEGKPRYPSPLGSVRDTESVARLLRIKPKPKEWTPFRREDLFPRSKGEPCNVTGRSSGVSVDRCDGLTDEQLRSASRRLAALVLNDEPGGAIKASAGEIRKIRLDGSQDLQAVKIYDDAKDGNDRHAVLRGHSEITAPRRAELILLVENAFRIVVTM